MMSEIVLDASALLALLNKEPGYEQVHEILPSAIMSAVNYAEVIMVLIRLGISEIEATKITIALIRKIIPFDQTQAVETAVFREKTKKLGLSLGDRACLSLAKLRQVPVITADKGWAKLDIGVKVQILR